MIYFYNIHNKDAVLEDGHNVESRDGLRATGWDLWTEMMRYPDRFEPEYFKYYSCVATIDCITPNAAYKLTNNEDAFVDNYFDAVFPLTETGNIPSMSVGDIVFFYNHDTRKHEFWMCDKYGWTELKELNESREKSMAKTKALRASIEESA
jgi:hypothetical protein|tara:strand:- start:325 stop:777 length:453 start_codon:yes stop_codon:yes gene_type:complete